MRLRFDGRSRSTTYQRSLRSQRRNPQYPLTIVTLSYLLHCGLAAAQCIVIGPVCLFVGGCVGGGWVCYHDNSKLCASILTKLGFLQLIKFWPSCAPGKLVCGGANFLAPPYYSQRAVFGSPPSAFFICLGRR